MRKVLILFGVLEDSDVEWLGSVGHVLDISAGKAVIVENQRSESVFILLNGRCSVTVTALKNQSVAELWPGEVFGEMSFVDSRPPSASVNTLERSQLLAVPRDRLSGRMERDYAFAARFYRALAIFLGARLRTTVSQLGYVGKGQSNSLPEEEMDGVMLDLLSAASRRFDDLQRRLLGHA